jgi:hypothetical protein
MLLISIPKITTERPLNDFERARIRKLSLLGKRDLLSIHNSLHVADKIRLERQLRSTLMQ